MITRPIKRNRCMNQIRGWVLSKAKIEVQEDMEQPTEKMNPCRKRRVLLLNEIWSLTRTVHSSVCRTRVSRVWPQKRHTVTDSCPCTEAMALYDPSILISVYCVLPITRWTELFSAVVIWPEARNDLELGCSWPWDGYISVAFLSQKLDNVFQFSVCQSFVEAVRVGHLAKAGRLRTAEDMGVKARSVRKWFWTGGEGRTRPLDGHLERWSYSRL